MQICTMFSGHKRIPVLQVKVLHRFEPYAEASHLFVVDQLNPKLIIGKNLKVSDRCNHVL